jgi:uncharacterized protein with HEPN domain
MTDEARKRLLDAYGACEAIQQFVRHVGFDTYEDDLLLRSAVERQLEIMGEALGHAANENEALEERIPAIPRIVALRNRVIHGYDSVDDEIVWDIVQSHVPTLKSRLQDLLERGEIPPEARA